MGDPAVVAWVLSLTRDLHRTQAKTLAALVAAATRVGRVSLAALGRALAGGTTAKHKIKRVGRFCANPRVHVADAMQGLIRHLTHQRQPLLVALDWVEVRAFHTLMAAAVFGGRALPLLWASYPEWELHKSQNNLEEGLLRLLRALVPDGVPVTLLFDRGFGRAELARTCQHLRFHFVIRIRPEVYVAHRRYRGLLCDYPVKKGMRRVLRDAAYRKSDPVTLSVVIRWKKGLPAKRDEPWFLVTDLSKKTAVALTELYGRRMAIEELFRDDKSCRNGYALRLTQVRTAARFDRLLLVLGLAYILTCGVGLWAKRYRRPGEWSSSNTRDPASAFAVGRAMWGRVQLSAAAIFALILQATTEAAKRWG